MKTIDILIEELPKRGGWPENVTHIGQDYDSELMFYGRGNVRSGIFLDQLAVDHRKCGMVGTKITREQYEAALTSKNGGWIEWGGGEHPPVSTNTVVDVNLRCGSVTVRQQAGVMNWRSNAPDEPGDIIAYRLHKPQETEQAEADDEYDLNECIGQDAAQVWGGDGKPAIGEKCEHHSGGQWEAVTIAGIYENLVTGFTDYWMVKEDGSSYTVGNPYRFRPIRSEADKKREDALDAIYGAIASAERAHNRSDEADKVYEAIAAGKIPGVKLED